MIMTIITEQKTISTNCRGKKNKIIIEKGKCARLLVDQK